jgi:hypothetical protein
MLTKFRITLLSIAGWKGSFVDGPGQVWDDDLLCTVVLCIYAYYPGHCFEVNEIKFAGLL